MKRYFYQTQLSEYKSGLVTYLNKKNKEMINIRNIYIYKKRVEEFYKKLQYYYDNYSLKIKKIIEEDGMNLGNINEVLKFDMYLYNIVSIYQDDTIFEECFDLEENLNKWIHCVDKDAFLAYFDRKYDVESLNDKKIFFDFFSEEPKLHKIM